MAGSGVTLYAATSAGNKTIVGTIDWRENIYMPSQINDNLAQIMADMRALANSIGAGWIEIGDLDGVYTAQYSGAYQFAIMGVDVTPYYRVGMRVAVSAPTPGQLKGTISAVSFSTNTYVTVIWDAGTLSNEPITAVYLGIASGDRSAPPTGVFTQCRLVYGNATTILLQRYGGKFLTIDDQTQTIPSVGVSLTTVAGQAGINPLYIYAYMVGNVMTLLGQTQAPVVDPRNGIMVSSGSAALTLVGMASVRITTNDLFENANNQAVSSYWNRRARAFSFSQTANSTSTTLVPIHTPLSLLTWNDSAVQLKHVGYGLLSVVGFSASQLLQDVAAYGPLSVGYFSVATGQLPVPLGYDFHATDGLHTYQLAGYVSSGTGTWVGNTFATVMG